MEKPLAMTDKQWNSIMNAHKEIVAVLDKHQVPPGFACKILIDIERSIDGGMMRTIKAVKGTL